MRSHVHMTLNWTTLGLISTRDLLYIFEQNSFNRPEFLLLPVNNPNLIDMTGTAKFDIRSGVVNCGKSGCRCMLVIYDNINSSKYTLSYTWKTEF